MRMSRIDSTEGSEELTGFDLEIEWKTGCLKERFLHFDLGLVVVIQLEHDVGKALEVGIDRSIESELDIAGVKSALLRIMIADLDVIEILRAGVGKCEQTVERNV